MKNFGKYLPLVNSNPMTFPLKEIATTFAGLPNEDVLKTGLKGWVGDIGSGIGEVAPALMTGYNIFSHLSKLDDPNANKPKEIIQAALAPISLIPGVGLIANAASAGMDAADYLNDVITGRKDAPEIGDIAQKNPVAVLPNKVINSGITKNFFSNFGNHSFGVF
jgi:hypothetical protein